MIKKKLCTGDCHFLTYACTNTHTKTFSALLLFPASLPLPPLSLSLSLYIYIYIPLQGYYCRIQLWIIPAVTISESISAGIESIQNISGQIADNMRLCNI